MNVNILLVFGSKLVFRLFREIGLRKCPFFVLRWVDGGCASICSLCTNSLNRKVWLEKLKDEKKRFPGFFLGIVRKMQTFHMQNHASNKYPYSSKNPKPIGSTVVERSKEKRKVGKISNAFSGEILCVGKIPRCFSSMSVCIMGQIRVKAVKIVKKKLKYALKQINFLHFPTVFPGNFWCQSKPPLNIYRVAETV